MIRTAAPAAAAIGLSLRADLAHEAVCKIAFLELDDAAPPARDRLIEHHSRFVQVDRQAGALVTFITR